MVDAAPAWRSTLSAVVLHPTDPCLLMRQRAEGWSLPSIELAERAWLPWSQPIIRGIRDEVGLETVVLRYTAVTVDEHPAAPRLGAVYVLEMVARVSAVEAPADTRWIGHAELADLPLAQPAQQPLLTECVRELQTGVMPPLRPAWARRGWFSRVATWIETELARAGSPSVAPIEQIKTWGVSCVMRVPTTAGDVYFKATPVSGVDPIATQPGDGRAPLRFLFANEPALMGALAARFPGQVPEPLAIDRAQHWLLLRDFGQPLGYGAPIEEWEGALAVYGALQVASVPAIDALLAAGCLDRRLDRLPAQLDALCADPDALASLDPAEAAHFRAAAPRLRALCDELASYGLPPTLMHGDFHLGNVVAHNNTFAFFDWTDGCISHPGFDLATYWEGVEEVFPNAAEVKERLRAAYLTPWTRYLPMPQLLEASRLTDTLGALHLTISYGHIVANLEPDNRTVLNGGVAYFVGATLRALDGSREAGGGRRE